MKKNLIILSFVLFGLIGCKSEYAQPSEHLLIVGEVIKVNIQSPHPYLNSINGTNLVWSYTLAHTNATNLKLHFKKVEVKYYHNQINKGETEVRGIIPAKGIDLDYPNNIDIFPDDMEKILSTWVGDYIIIRDGNRKIIAIVGGSCPHESLGYEDQCSENGFWLNEPVKGDIAIIELHADDKENGYGLNIDKYSRGFTEEEIKIANEQSTRKYYEDCVRREIPLDKCPIPK